MPPLVALLPRKAIHITTLLLTLFILWVGLRHASVSPEQGVTWNGNAWQVNGQGLILSDPGELRKIVTGNTRTFGHFDWHVTIDADPLTIPEFTIIASLTNGSEWEQLVIGQWSSWLIVLQGNDYQNAAKENRLALNLADTGPLRNARIRVTGFYPSAQLWLDDQLIKQVDNANLVLPGDPESWQLTLGNTLDGGHGWFGNVHELGLSLFEPGTEVVTQSTLKPAGGFLTVAESPENNEPLLLSRDPVLLHAMPAGRYPQRLFLKPMRPDLLQHKSFRQDLVLNLLGFGLPGFFWFFTLYTALYLRSSIALVSATAICFGLSFYIEFMQSFVAGRNSHMHDLVLNSIGGFLGAFAAMLSVPLLRFKLIRPGRDGNRLRPLTGH